MWARVGQLEPTASTPQSRSTPARDSNRVFFFVFRQLLERLSSSYLTGLQCPFSSPCTYASRPVQQSVCSLKTFPHRALANFKISSFSTSQVAFECVWTGIFALLQIGRVQSYTVSWSLDQKKICDNSGKHLRHA